MLGLVRPLAEYVAPFILILGVVFRHLFGFYVKIFFGNRLPSVRGM
jgi:hypothetical protein